MGKSPLEKSKNVHETVQSERVMLFANNAFLIFMCIDEGIIKYQYKAKILVLFVKTNVN